MPIYEDKSLQLNSVTQLDLPEDAPGFVDVVSAAFQTENAVGSILSRGAAPESPNFKMTNSYAPNVTRIDNDDIDYDALDHIQGYEEHAYSFINKTEEQANWIKANIDRERESREDLEAAGFAGVAASFAAGLLDPIQWATFGPGKSLLYGGVVKATAKTAAAAATGATLSELALQATQEERTGAETAFAIGGAGLLGGILGGAGALLSKSEFDELAKVVAKEVEDTPSINPKDAGAAATRGTTLEEESLVSIGGFEKTTKLSPYGRVIQSPSLKVRQVSQDLAENNYYMEKNNAGKPTGQSVETAIKMYNSMTGQASEHLDASFLSYRNSKGTGLTGRSVVAAKDILGAGSREGKLSYSQFKEEVGKAMRNGDKSDIAEVANAAANYRKNVFDPVKKAAIDIGSLSEDVDVKFADSYLTRVYNFEKLSKHPDKFKAIVKDWARSQAKDLPDQEELQMLLKEQAETLEDLTIKFGEAKAITAKHGDEIKRLRQLKVDSEAEIKLVPEGKMDSGRKKGLIDEARNIKEKIRAEQSQLSKAVKSREALKKELSGERKVNRAAKSNFKKARKLNQPGYLDSLADDIYDNIVGTPGGIVPKNVIPEGSPFKSRTLPIRDEKLEFFLENDIEVVADYYIRSTAPEIEITAKYGDRDMKSAIADIREDFNELIKKSPEKAGELNKELERNIKDIEAMRDLLYGKYNQPTDPNSFWLRANKTIRELQFLSKLGGMMLSSIPDLARPIMVHGLKSNAKMISALARNPKQFKMAAKEARKNAAIFEMIQSTRANSMADIGDMYKQGTKFEKGVHAMTNTFGVVSLMSPWNQVTKQWAGMISSDFIMRETIKWADGTISATSKRKLAQLGIGEADAKGIAEQVNLHADKGDVWLVNSQKWDKDFAKSFKLAVIKDVDSMIVTPGVGDLSLWMRGPTGKLIGQFKSFSFASHNKMLVAGLQQRDASAFEGFMVSIALGAMTYGLKQAMRGEDIDTDPSKVITEAINYSGTVALLGEANGIVEKATRGNVGFSAVLGNPPMSRYASRNFMGAVLGPTAGTIEGVGSVLGGIGMQIGDEPQGFTQRDLRALRRLMPYQNLWYTRNLLNYVEEKTGEVMGLPQ